MISIMRTTLSPFTNQARPELDCSGVPLSRLFLEGFDSLVATTVVPPSGLPSLSPTLGELLHEI